jgi:hypothetical protein
MTQRRSQPIEADIPMFALDGLVPEQPAPELDYTVSVSIQERALSLNMALASLAQENKRNGLMQAAAGDPHLIGLQARYGHRLSKVLEAASDNREDDKSTALNKFRHAAGYWAILKSGAINKSELDKSTYADFAKFKSDYVGSPEKTKERNTYRRDLQAQAGLAKPRRKKQKLSA